MAPLVERLRSVLRVDESPAAQESLDRSQARAAKALTLREAVAETVVGGSFAAAALLLLATADLDGLSPGYAALLVLCFAAIARVEFDVGRFYTMPSQLVLVPMLLLLPPGIVPLLVVAGYTLAKLPERVTGRLPVGRLLLTPADSWFSLGPAVVLTLAGSPCPAELTLPIALAALGAQFAGDVAASTVRECIAGDSSRAQAGELAWIHTVDLVLSPLGLMAALAADRRPWAVLLLLSLALLLRLFAFERQARLDHLRELSRAYRGTAVLLGEVVESDHEYTGSHSRDVVELAVRVGEVLGVDPVQRRRIEFGALLHDVGKIAVPKEIVDKPGPLDEAEWAVMRRHTIAGEAMLAKVGGVLADVGRVVRSSHERFDGGGYPDGLAGEEIPIESRIVACCDAFSAMTTTRAYRRARPASEAIEELERCAGTQFDPRVVRALVALLRRGRREELPAASPRGEDPLPPPPAADLEHTTPTPGALVVR